MRKIHLSSVIAMIGGTVGAGIFGVPYVMSRAGVPVGIAYIIILGAAAAIVNIFYVVVAAETPGKHRLIGYVRKHVGPRSAYLVGFINTFELLGALLVYLLLGGNFLSTIFGGNEFYWMLVFFAVVASILLLPLRKSDRLDRFFTSVLIVIIAAIVIIAVPRLATTNLSAVHLTNWFLPYGLIFFALGGSSIIPEIVELSRKNEKSALRSVALGTVLAAGIIGLFGIIVAGVSGGATSEEAIAGLIPYFGRPIVILGSVCGLLAVATQFVIIGSYLRDQFAYDFKLPRVFSWFIAAGVPLAAYFVGARDFINIIGFLGATMGAAVGFTIVFMARRIMVNKNKFPLLRRFAFPLMILFAAGLVAEVVSLF